MIEYELSYPPPFNRELRELYKTPYRFSKQLQDYALYVFKHPSNQHNKVFNKLHKPTDINDMLKPAYLLTRYYLDNPQQFGNNFFNIEPTIITRMWKTFISIHKHFRKTVFDTHLATDFKMLSIGDGRLIDLLLEEVTKELYEMEPKKKTRGYSEKQLAYYDTLV